MALRNVFEVVSVKLILNSGAIAEWSNKEEEEINKYLSSIASNINSKHSCALFDDGQFVVDIEFSKGISFITVIYILDQIYSGTGNMLSIEYKEINNTVMVTIS